MSNNSNNKKFEICIMVTATCTLLVGFWIVMATPETAMAKKPGSDDTNQDIPVIVDVVDLYPGVLSDSAIGGSNLYIDKKKDHISTFVGRSAGQFILHTNTINSPEGRTMMFIFPGDDLEDPGFPNTDSDENSYTITPIAAEIYTARASVGAENGYVDLRNMEIYQSSDLALRIRLIVTDSQSPWDLNYGDVLFDPSDEYYDLNMDLTDLVTVTRINDINGKKVWIIETNASANAYLRRVEQWGPWIPVGIYSMPMSLTITEK